MKSYTFHVKHMCSPSSLQALIDLISEYPGAEDEALIEYGALQGLPIGTTVNSSQSLRENLTQCLRDFNLVDRKKNEFTALGLTFRDVTWQKPQLFGELIHYLFFSTWTPNVPGKYCYSWSYASTVRLLWSSGHMELNVQRLADDISDQIKQQFPAVAISFGANSIRGVLHWLRVLAPAVLPEQNKPQLFARRSFCPPELFVLAVDTTYRQNGIPYGSNLLLEPAIQQQICELCVLEPEGFERVAGYAKLQFTFLDRGMGGGWGSYLRLDRAPTFADFK